MGFIQTGAGGIGSGDQTVEGVKTFEDLPLLVGLPTENEQAANKEYVDLAVAGGGGGGGVGKRVTTWTTGSTITYTHNLNTLDIVVSVREITGGELVGVNSIVVVDVNNVTLTASQTPPAGGWRVVVVG